MSSRRSGIVVSRPNNNQTRNKSTSSVPARASERQCVREDINYAPVALVEEEDQRDEEEYEEEDDEEVPPVVSKRRGRPLGSTSLKRKAPASEDGIEDQLQPEPKKGRGRPRKEAVAPGGKGAQKARAKVGGVGGVGGQKLKAQVESEDEVRSDEEEDEQAGGERDEEEQEDEDPLP